MKNIMVLLALGLLFSSLGLAQPNNSPAMLGDIRAEYRGRVAGDSAISAKMSALEARIKALECAPQSSGGVDSAWVRKFGDGRWVNMTRNTPNGEMGKSQKTQDSIKTRFSLTETKIARNDTITARLFEVVKGQDRTIRNVDVRLAMVEELVSVKDALNTENFSDAQMKALEELQKFYNPSSKKKEEEKGENRNRR